MNKEEKILNILEKMQSDMTEVKKDLRDVKSRMVIMENEHGQSLAALHDGYKLFF